MAKKYHIQKCKTDIMGNLFTIQPPWDCTKIKLAYYFCSFVLLLSWITLYFKGTCTIRFETNKKIRFQSLIPWSILTEISVVRVIVYEGLFNYLLIRIGNASSFFLREAMIWSNSGDPSVRYVVSLQTVRDSEFNEPYQI